MTQPEIITFPFEESDQITHFKVEKARKHLSELLNAGYGLTSSHVQECLKNGAMLCTTCNAVIITNCICNKQPNEYATHNG